MKTGRRFVYFFSLLFLLPILVSSQISFAQALVKGKVVYENDGSPAAFVSIELAHDKETRTMSDNAGNFHITVKESQKKDSLVISSVGYKALRIPVSAALVRSVFTLSPLVKTIEGVTVFNQHHVIGSMSESVGYYRSWDYKKNKKGEIGRVFKLPYKKFKIDKIRFKAGNTCDTCLLRLHIRTMINGEPGNDIFKDSISVYVNKLSLDSKISEFDLTPYNFTFTENEIFVSMELLNCGNGKNGFCSFNFAGTEKGEYLYRTHPYEQWQSTDDYTIYLKLFLRF